MQSIYLNVVAIVGILILYGCSPIVGGECKYGERVVGSATIKSLDKGCIVDFRPINQNVELKFKDMSALCYVNNRVVGETYRAIYEKELAGACKPYRVIVYDEVFLKKRPDVFEKYNLR